MIVLLRGKLDRKEITRRIMQSIAIPKNIERAIFALTIVNRG